jgi:hypothetical protein
MSRERVRYEAPGQKALDKRMRNRDKPGQHLWVMTVAWACPDPERISYGDQILLDAETVLAFAGPGCFKCEREYSRALARKPCTGDVTELQP